MSKLILGVTMMAALTFFLVACGEQPTSTRVAPEEVTTAPEAPEAERIEGSKAKPIEGSEAVQVEGSEAKPTESPGTEQVEGSEAKPTEESEHNLKYSLVSKV